MNDFRSTIMKALQSSAREKVASEDIFGDTREETAPAREQSLTDEAEKVASALESVSNNWDRYRAARTPAELLAEHDMLQRTLLKMAEDEGALPPTEGGSGDGLAPETNEGETGGPMIAPPTGPNAPMVNAEGTGGVQPKMFCPGAATQQIPEEEGLEPAGPGDGATKLPDNIDEMLPPYPPDLLAPVTGTEAIEEKAASAFGISRGTSRLAKLLLRKEAAACKAPGKPAKGKMPMKKAPGKPKFASDLSITERVQLVRMKLADANLEDPNNAASFTPAVSIPQTESLGQAAGMSGEATPETLPEPDAQTSVLDSIQALINLTKAEAKAVPKRELANVLDEPALSAQTDPTLQEVLDNAVAAGVKVSSAKAPQVQRLAQKVLLKKVASEPCTCNDGSCPNCRFVAALKARRT